MEHKVNQSSEAPAGNVYQPWMGMPVILQVASAELRVPLRGVLIGETEDAVRVRVDEGWDIDIYKSLILSVEQDKWAGLNKTSAFRFVRNGMENSSAAIRK